MLSQVVDEENKSSCYKLSSNGKPNMQYKKHIYSEVDSFEMSNFSFYTK